jgi:hypothetical protein
MRPGYGYGGPCYPRDNQALARLPFFSFSFYFIFFFFSPNVFFPVSKLRLATCAWQPAVGNLRDNDALLLCQTII